MLKCCHSLTSTLGNLRLFKKINRIKPMYTVMFKAEIFMKMKLETIQIPYSL